MQKNNFMSLQCLKNKNHTKFGTNCSKEEKISSCKGFHAFTL